MSLRFWILTICATVCSYTDSPQADKIEFKKPVRLKAAGEVIKIEEPGYGCPCWADINRDGRPDLLVGQFNNGKIQVFLGDKNGQLQPGEFLKAENEIVQIPGMW